MMDSASQPSLPLLTLPQFKRGVQVEKKKRPAGRVRVTFSPQSRTSRPPEQEQTRGSCMTGRVVRCGGQAMEARSFSRHCTSRAPRLAGWESACIEEGACS